MRRADWFQRTRPIMPNRRRRWVDRHTHLESPVESINISAKTPRVVEAKEVQPY